MGGKLQRWEGAWVEGGLAIPGGREVAGKKTDCVRCLHLLEFSERNQERERKTTEALQGAASREQREE